MKHVDFCYASFLGKMDFREIVNSDNLAIYDVRILAAERQPEEIMKHLDLSGNPVGTVILKGRTAKVDWSQMRCVVEFEAHYGGGGMRTIETFEWTFPVVAHKKAINDSDGEPMITVYTLIEKGISADQQNE